MIRLGLTDDERTALNWTMLQSHKEGVDVRILDRDEEPVASFTAPVQQVVAGGVDVDATSDITRQLDMTVADPHRKIRFEHGSPSRGAVFADNFVKVRKLIYVPDVVYTLSGDLITGMDEWVPIPVFHGPLTGFKRKGPELNLLGQGKESLGLAPHAADQGYTLHQGQKVTSAIREVLGNIGEEHFHLHESDRRLQKAMTVDARAEPWLVVAGSKKVGGFHRRIKVFDPPIHGAVGYDYKPAVGLVMAFPGDYDIFYDGDGFVRTRPFDQHPTFTIAEGVNLADEEPEVGFDIGDAPNKVIVEGGKRKGHKPAHGEAVLPAHNPFSPHAMARNGQPRVRVHRVKAEHLKTDHECKAHAEKILRRMARESLDVSCNMLANPMLEENDMLRLRTAEWNVEFRARQFSIPLGSDELMSMGHHERVKLRHKKHHHHHRHHRHRGQAGPPGGRGGSGHRGRHHRKRRRK